MWRKIAKNNEQTVFFLLIVVYRLLLDYTYTNIISVKYAYTSFKSINSMGWYIVSWLLLIAFSQLVLKSFLIINRISDEIIFLIFILITVPYTSMVAWGHFNFRATVLMSIYWVFLYLAQRTLTFPQLFSMAKREVKTKSLEKCLNFLCIGSFLLVGFISWKYAHFRFNFSLSSDIVYSIRGQAKENVLPSIIRYLFSWTKVTVPILTAYYVSKKNNTMIVFCIITQLLSFGYDGSKTPFLMTLLALLFNVFHRFKIEKINRWILLGIVVFVGLGVLEFVFFKSYVISGVFVRRISFVPNLVSGFYFDFFSNNPPDYFRSSILSDLFDGGPYPALQSSIGSLYMGSSYWMNCGLFADAFTNMGNLGVLLFPWVLVFFLRVLDNCSRKLDIHIYITSSLYIALSLINSFLSTVLITHGLIVLMILLYIMQMINGKKAINQSQYVSDKEALS